MSFTLIEVENAFENAIVRTENINDDGSWNWDFVSADVFMDVPIQRGESGRLQNMIDSLIDWLLVQK
ncbi:MAG: hypothetical protein HOK57_10080 [Planctomycetaceae bacterium]|jgi:hypothetical protein|nr:hypothetical protein [Bacteroidetes Order II. bacterium]MBT6460161.1 hypothetical protein [Planctomycetaceae bacterium]